MRSSCDRIQHVFKLFVEIEIRVEPIGIEWERMEPKENEWGREAPGGFDRWRAELSGTEQDRPQPNEPNELRI